MPVKADPPPAFPYAVCDAVSLDPPQSVIFGFRCASTPQLADALSNGGAQPIAGATFNICHGELAATCGLHAEYTVFEECNDDNGIGTALPAASAMRLCPDAKSYDLLVDVPGQAGDNCGYSWYHLHCD